MRQFLLCLAACLWLSACAYIPSISSVQKLPIGTAAGLVGQAIDDKDVRAKARQLNGASADTCDEVLGAPLDVFHDESRTREWRVYEASNPIPSLYSYRYVVQFRNGRATAIAKATRGSDIVGDAVTDEYFRCKCLNTTPDVCEDVLGQRPALSIWSDKTGELLQIYDARLIKSLQRPYFAVLHFGENGICTSVNVAEIVSSAGTLGVCENP